MIEEISLALPRMHVVDLERTVDLTALVSEHSATLFRVAHSLLRGQAEAEDVVQDTFVRVLEHRSQLPAVREMRPWLIRIAWNLAVDRRRRMRPEQMDDVFAATLAARTTPADTVLGEARQVRAVLMAIDGLPKSERQVLLLSALEELDATEIAAVMGKSAAAVRGLLFRARTHLRARLQVEKGGRA